MTKTELLNSFKNGIKAMTLQELKSLAFQLKIEKWQTKEDIMEALIKMLPDEGDIEIK